MAEICFVGISLIGFCIPMFALRMGKEWLIALLPIVLITGNVFAQSFIVVAGFMTSLAIPVYASTFLITDLLAEHHGRRDALRAVWVGFMGQIVFLSVMLLVLAAPIFPDSAKAYSAAFSTVPRLVLGSLIAYLISQPLDVRIYDTIRHLTGEKKMWLRNNLSTMISQAVDTTIFLFIAFWRVAPFAETEAWIKFALATWLFKIIVAAVDTPFLYWARLIVRKET